MIKTITNCIVLILCTVSLSFAQTGSISGTVKTSDGSPAELVTISVRGTGKAPITASYIESQLSKNGHW